MYLLEQAIGVNRNVVLTAPGYGSQIGASMFLVNDSPLGEFGLM